MKRLVLFFLFVTLVTGFLCASKKDDLCRALKHGGIFIRDQNKKCINLMYTELGDLTAVEIFLRSNKKEKLISLLPGVKSGAQDLFSIMRQNYLLGLIFIKETQVKKDISAQVYFFSSDQALERNVCNFLKQFDGLAIQVMRDHFKGATV